MQPSTLRLRMAARTAAMALASASLLAGPACAAEPTYDPALAASTGANDNGMRQYVFVLLKTGPTRVPAGPERDEMFKGHFENIGRLAREGKLLLAGPYDGVDGWRGMFLFAVPDIASAKALVATDPVVIKGEMVPEFHEYWATGALMLVPDLHQRIVRKP